MAKAVLNEFETHEPLVAAGVKIDFVFAFADVDDSGQQINDAIRKGGIKCLGLARKISLKDRAKGNGDAEITIDGNWWDEAIEGERKALLDHELHHLAVKIDKRGLVRDDLGRPVLQMRKHDVEVGWFKIIAHRHGVHSQERQQAAQIMCDHGQYFWPGLAGVHTDVAEQVSRKVRSQPEMVGK